MPPDSILHKINNKQWKNSNDNANFCQMLIIAFKKNQNESFTYPAFFTIMVKNDKFLSLILCLLARLKLAVAESIPAHSRAVGTR